MSDPNNPLAGLDPATVLLHTLVSQLMMPHAFAQHLEAQNAAANKHLAMMDPQTATAVAAQAALATIQQQQMQQALAVAAQAQIHAAQQASAAAAAAAQTNASTNSSTSSTTQSSTSSSSYSNGNSKNTKYSSNSNSNNNSRTSGSSSTSGTNSSGTRPPCACKDCLAGKPPPPSSSSSNYNSGGSGSGGGFGRSLSDAQSRYSNSDSSSNVTSIGVLKQMNQSGSSNSPPMHGSNGGTSSSTTSNSYGSKGNSSYRSGSSSSYGRSGTSGSSSSYRSGYSNGGSGSKYNSLPPSLVQSTMVPAPSIGHMNMEKLDNSFGDGPSPSPMVFPYSSSPILSGTTSAQAATIPSTSLSPAHKPVASGSSASGPPVFDAAAAMIVMSNSPPLNSVSPSLGAQIPSLDAFPPAATSTHSSKSSHHRTSTPNSVIDSPLFRFHSPTASPTFNMPSPSLPSILMKNPLDLRAMSNSPLTGGRTLGTSTSNNSLNTSLTGSTLSTHATASSSAHQSSSASLLLSTPSASYLRPTPTSPSSLVFSSFLKSPILSGASLPGAALGKNGELVLGTSATSVTTASLLLNGSDVARVEREKDTVNSLSTIAAGPAAATTNSSLQSSMTTSTAGRDSSGVSQAVGSIMSPSSSSSISMDTSAGANLSPSGPNLSILQRLKHINSTTTATTTNGTTPTADSTTAASLQASVSPTTSSSDSTTSSNSVATTTSQSIGSLQSTTTSSLTTKSSSSTSTHSHATRPNQSFNSAPPIPPGDVRKRTRDVYEGSSSTSSSSTTAASSSSSSSSSECAHPNCPQCQAIAAQKAAAAASGSAGQTASSASGSTTTAHSAPTTNYITPNPFPSTPFSTSQPHPVGPPALGHSLLKSPLMPSFTPIFPTTSSLNLLVPSSTLLTSTPVPSSRRNSLAAIMSLSPALRPLTGSPMMTGRGVSGVSSHPNAGTSANSLNLPLPNTLLKELDRASPSPSLLDAVLSTSSPMSIGLSGTSPSPQSFMCHQCTQHRPHHTLVFCCHAYTKKGVRMQHGVCTNKYCESCLLTHYTPEKVGIKNSAIITQFPPTGKRHDINHQWECPACRGVCSCPACGTSPLLPLSEVNPLTLTPSHTLAYAYVFMSEYLEDSMVKPPTDAQAADAAAAVGLANAATYAVATSPIIRSVKLEDRANGTPSSHHPNPHASINLCHIPQSMSTISSDDDDDDDDDIGVSRSTSTGFSDRKLLISKTSPIFGRSLAPTASSTDALGTMLIASRSPLLQSMTDAMRTDGMPTVKLDGSSSTTSTAPKHTYLSNSTTMTSSSGGFPSSSVLGSMSNFVPTLPSTHAPPSTLQQALTSTTVPVPVVVKTESLQEDLTPMELIVSPATKTPVTLNGPTVSPPASDAVVPMEDVAPSTSAPSTITSGPHLSSATSSSSSSSGSSHLPLLHHQMDIDCGVSEPDSIGSHDETDHAHQPQQARAQLIV